MAERRRWAEVRKCSAPMRIGEPIAAMAMLLASFGGSASVQLACSGKKDGNEHLRITQTSAFMALCADVATPIPDDLRPRIEEYLVT